MIIRPIEPGEIAALASLARDTYALAFGHSYAPSDLAAILKDELSDATFRAAIAKDIFLVAITEGGLVGFVQFGAVGGTTPTAKAGDQELRRLYVRPDWQSRGIGQRLIEAAFAHPSLTHAERIFIDVWEHNLAARRLYERFGFEVIGAYKPAVASGLAPDNDLIMVRRRRPSHHDGTP